MTDTAGPLLFARYAYPPNALGLCGADTPRTLLEYGDAHASETLRDVMQNLSLTCSPRQRVRGARDYRPCHSGVGRWSVEVAELRLGGGV